MAIAQCVIFLQRRPSRTPPILHLAKHSRWRARRGSLMPPMCILNAPTTLMHNIGYGKGYVYDHATEEGFSGQNYFPEGVPRRGFIGRTIAALSARSKSDSTIGKGSAPGTLRSDRRGSLTLVIIHVCGGAAVFTTDCKLARVGGAGPGTGEARAMTGSVLMNQTVTVADRTARCALIDGSSGIIRARPWPARKAVAHGPHPRRREARQGGRSDHAVSGDPAPVVKRDPN